MKSVINDESLDYNEEGEIVLENEDFQTKTPTETDIVEGDENVYPMKTIKVDKGYFTVFELKRKYDKEPSQIILDSDFQRESVWKLSQKRELIESVLMGLPLPIFYLNEDKYGKLIVVDGRQRLTALFEFMDNKFNLGKLKILSEYSNLKFKDFEFDPKLQRLQSQIEDYQIISHVIQPPTPDRIKFDIFDRVNRAGTQLNKQEIRNALYQGNATKFLSDICKSREFIDATYEAFKNDKRMKDKYILLRFVAFYLYFNEKLLLQNEKFIYTSDVDELLGITMEYLNEINETELGKLKNITLIALRKVYLYLDENAFRLVDLDDTGNLVKRYPININIFENIMYAMTLISADKEDLKSTIKNEFDNLKNSVEFRDSINNHRDSEPKVMKRYNMIMKIVGEINDR